MISQKKKENGVEDRVRVLFFQDGICVSSVDGLDPDRIQLNKDITAKYHIFIGSDGPCEVSVNIGGKIFRAHHDEINRGIIDVAQLPLMP